MGEYARYNGEEIKIGTCEELYYLRADQRSLIEGYSFAGTEVFRFRFPWPDEDKTEPGSFDPYNRTCCLYGLQAPEELAEKHYNVQFRADAGYLASLPCPERFSTEGGLGCIDVRGIPVHRNGFRGRVLLCQQRFFEGRLVGIAECGGCGLKWRLSREEAIQAAEGLQEEAKQRRGSEDWYLQVALRLVRGYTEPQG